MGEEEKSTAAEVQEVADIAAEVQQEECEDYAVDVTTASSWYKNVSYDDAKIFIRTNIESAARSFIAIGYYLKLIRDGELYREEGHESIWAFAMAEYGISKSTASRYMSMNDRFSADGNSPIVDQKYKDFEKSKLQEMLSLTDEQLEQVTPAMKVQEIRAMRQPKEIPYFELEGQMDLETDFPEVLPSVPEMPAVMQQPADIQTTMTLEEMMGEDESEEGQETEGVATSQQETPSVVLETAANNQESAAEKQQTDENLEELETAGMVEEPPEYDRELPEEMIQIQEEQLEYMGPGWKERLPEAYTEHCMMLRAYKVLLEAQDAADQEQEPVVQPELPLLRNNDQRAAFIDNYESWPLWIEIKETGERYYRYDLPDGTSFVIKTYLSTLYDYQAGTGLHYKEGYGNNEQYILKPGKLFKDCRRNRSAMIEELKELQKGEK